MSEALLRAALRWCVEHPGECLIDHPAKLREYRALVDEPSQQVEAQAQMEAAARRLIESSSQAAEVLEQLGADMGYPPTAKGDRFYREKPPRAPWWRSFFGGRL